MPTGLHDLTGCRYIGFKNITLVYCSVPEASLIVTDLVIFGYGIGSSCNSHCFFLLFAPLLSLSILMASHGRLGGQKSKEEAKEGE